MLIQGLVLAVVAWLPGAVLFRAPVAERSKRAALDPEERLFWAVILSVSISLLLTLALAYAGAFTLGRLLVANLLLSLVVGSASRFDLRLRAPRRYPTVAVLLPAGLVLLGLWRFFPASEFILGGRDPGIYVNEGIQIAQRGTFLYEDPLVREVPPFARELFFRSDNRPEFYGLRFMGFPLLDIAEGTVVGQFPHLFPASIAIAYGLDGLTGARRAVGVWAILGLLAVYFLGARLFGRPAGFAGAALLSLHLAQVWFARYPNTEVVMQALLFAALLATIRGYADDDRFFPPVAGFLLGSLLFLRVDAALAVAGVVAAIGLLATAGERWRAGFFLALVPLAGAAALYLVGPMYPYADRTIIFVTHFTWWQYALLALAAAGFAAAVVAGRRSGAVRARVRRYAPAAVTVILLAAAVYALFFRQPGGRLAAHDAYALRTITTYYLTLPALLAALVGYAIAARRAFWTAPAFFTTVALFSFFFFYKMHIVPEHFWVARRYVPLVIPACLLLAAAAALGTRGGPSRLRPMRWLLALVFLGLLGREYARVSERIIDHVEYAGIIPRLERLASAVGDGDLLIVESRDAQTDVHTLAVPLAHIYARSVLVFTSAAPNKAAFAMFLDWAAERYRRVLFLGAGGTDLLSSAWGARVLTSERFRVPEFVGEPGEFPRQARGKQFDYTLYQFGPAAVRPTGAATEVDVGTEDDLNVLRFHAKEETEGRSFRWSQDVSYVTLQDVSEQVRELQLWMSDGGRPDAAPPADVEVFIDDQRLGSARVGSGFKPYAFPIPAVLAARLAAGGAPVRVKLTTTIWNPAQVLGTADDRELGIMVDRVAVQ